MAERHFYRRRITFGQFPPSEAQETRDAWVRAVEVTFAAGSKKFGKLAPKQKREEGALSERGAVRRGQAGKGE